MWQTSLWIFKAAKEEIEVMKKTGEKIRPIPFGKSNDTLFVSPDRDLLLGFDVVAVDDTMYFIGFKKRK